MPAAQPQPVPGRAPNAEPVDPGGQRLRWLFAVTGVVLLVVSVMMMASGAPSRAQTVHPEAPAQLAQLTGKHLSTVARRGLNRPFMFMEAPASTATTSHPGNPSGRTAMAGVSTSP